MSRSPDDLCLFLKELRQNIGLSQRQVSDQLGLSSPQYISNIERGTCKPSLEVLVKLAEIYRIQHTTLTDIMVAGYRRSIEDKFKALKPEQGM